MKSRWKRSHKQQQQQQEKCEEEFSGCSSSVLPTAHCLPIVGESREAAQLNPAQSWLGRCEARSCCSAMVEVDYNDLYEGSAEDPVVEEEEEYDETGTRNTWAVLTWIMLALTILLNLVLIGILVVKRNLRSITNKSEF